MLHKLWVGEAAIYLIIICGKGTLRLYDDDGKLIFGNVHAVVGWLWISLMAYTRDQLINFQTAGVYTVPHPVLYCAVLCVKRCLGFTCGTPDVIACQESLTHCRRACLREAGHGDSRRGCSRIHAIDIYIQAAPTMPANNQGACLWGLRKRHPPRLPAVVLRLRAASSSPASTRARYETSRPMCAMLSNNMAPICLQSLRAGTSRKTIFRYVQTDGYRSFNGPRSSSWIHLGGSTGGGVILLYRDNISAKRITIDLDQAPEIQRRRTSCLSYWSDHCGVLQWTFVHAGAPRPLQLSNLHHRWSQHPPRRPWWHQHSQATQPPRLVYAHPVCSRANAFAREEYSTLSSPRVTFKCRSCGLNSPGKSPTTRLLLVRLQLPWPPVRFFDVTSRAWKNFAEEAFCSRPARPQRRVWHGRPKDLTPSGSYTNMASQDESLSGFNPTSRAALNSSGSTELPSGQWQSLLVSRRLRARSGPLHSLFHGGHQHRWAPRPQGSWLHRQPTRLWSRRSRWRLLSGGFVWWLALSMSNLGWPRIAFSSTRRKQS